MTSSEIPFISKLNTGLFPELLVIVNSPSCSPLPEAVYFTVKVVESPGATLDDGSVVTVKSDALAPPTLIGVVMVNAASPEL